DVFKGVHAFAAEGRLRFEGQSRWQSGLQSLGALAIPQVRDCFWGISDYESIPEFGRKGALFPCSDSHKPLYLSNPEKWCRFIHNLDCQKHGLDCTDGKKCGFTMPKAWLCHKYREAAALLLNSQLQGN
ncbi:MAG: hypothetical protein Q8S11_06495, partial [Daejeonella sp.]|uniref:hypothetical protein n=1 Tax=Daejeonella sp. TaxID=2805397 RepID=UPI0027376569